MAILLLIVEVLGMEKESYVIMLRPANDYGTQGTDEIVSAHFEYLKELHASGKVLMAGRFSDVLIGLVMVTVRDRAEAMEIMQKDPAIKAKVFHGELYKWRIALDPIP